MPHAFDRAAWVIAASIPVISGAPFLDDRTIELARVAPLASA